MFEESELLKAINELEKTAVTYQDAEKLATFYIVYDHHFKKRVPAVEPIREVTIDRYNGSEFFRTISCKNAKDVWNIMNEVMEMLRETQPNIYRAVIRRLNKLQ